MSEHDPTNGTLGPPGFLDGLFGLDGRLALVTGSSRGIGHTIARGLARAGARVVLNGRDAAALEGARAELSDAGHEVHARAFDVTDPDATHAGVDEIEATIGPIEVLVNNAGVQLRKPLLEFRPDEWDRIMTGNVRSVFLVGQAVARHMIERERGKIINICSVQSELARGAIAPYAASKGAVKMLTKGMCADWARFGIQVNGLAPGYFRTPLTRALQDDPDFDAWLRARVPAGRWGDPEELVGAAVFLASAASGFVNGHVLFVDGGIVSVV